jgi:exonuclease III
MNPSTSGKAIRLLTLNLQHGGKSRIEGIVQTITRYRPDIAILTEYRVGAGEEIAQRLKADGLFHQASSDPPPGGNGVFIASRRPFKMSGDGNSPVPSPQHWLEVQFREFGLGAIYNRVPDRAGALFGKWLSDSFLQVT